MFSGVPDSDLGVSIAGKPCKIEHKQTKQTNTHTNKHTYTQATINKATDSLFLSEMNAKLHHKTRTKIHSKGNQQQ